MATLQASVQTEIRTVGTTFTVPTEAFKIKLLALRPQRQGRGITVSLLLKYLSNAEGTSLGGGSRNS